MIAKPVRHAKVCLQFLTGLPLLAVLVLAASPVQARDMTGKGGVGMLVTTEGMPMAAFRYWRTNFAVELLVGYVATTPSPATVTRPDTTQVRAAIGFLYRIADAPKTSLAIGLRPWLQYRLTSYSIYLRPNNQALTEMDPGFWSFGAEIPLHGEVFLNDHFSLIGHVGLTIDLGAPLARSDAAATTLDQAKDTNLLIGIRGGFSGGAGVTYYF